MGGLGKPGEQFEGLLGGAVVLATRMPLACSMTARVSIARRMSSASVAVLW
jgi:hypothetical protein